MCDVERTAEDSVSRGQHIVLERLPWEDGNGWVQPQHLSRAAEPRVICAAPCYARHLLYVGLLA